MIGPHDVGGAVGFGAIDAEPEGDEPVFHHDWERRVFGVTMAAGFLGRWNLDESRHAREHQAPVDYLRNSYYETWLAGLERLLTERELLDDPTAAHRRADRDRVVRALARGRDSITEPLGPARFAVGDEVRARRRHPSGHTREPGYVMGCRGVIVAHHGSHVLPDAAAGGDRSGAHLYTVGFTARELWGRDGDPRSSVHVDLWEPYLDAADAGPASVEPTGAGRDEESSP
ncbi:MAG: nitrile hydratase subunit beta [Actinomycetota bacterium]|nr:nitrile hydratase subunit beta [Actinomycetota bacterium]